MSTIAAFLMGMVGPMVLRALMMLGVGLMTFTGVAAALQGLIDIAVNNWASVGADILALGGLAGIPQAAGIVCGAMVARVGIWVTASATKWITKA
jgi:hypothetical protein